MTPSEALLEQFAAEDTEVMFGIVGSAFMDFLDIMPKAGINYLAVRHEQNAAHMADGYAQALKGEKPGVCVAQNGPGVTNMVTGIKAAQLNHSPVIMLSPTATTGGIGTDTFQEADQMSIFEDCVDWQQRLEDKGRIAEYVRTAHRESLNQKGPAQIDFPRDNLYGEVEVDVLQPHQYRQTKVGGADDAEISKAVDLLEDAENPAIIAGLGVIYSDAMDEVADLAELLNAPVANSYLHNDSFPISHPLAVGALGYGGSKAAMEELNDADAVIAVGSRLSGFGLLPQYGLDWFPHDADIIQIDIDPSQIGRTTQVELGLVGDAARTVEGLVDKLDDSYGAPDSRVEEVQQNYADWKEELKEMSQVDQTPIHPRRALYDVTEALPQGTMIATDIGNTCSMANAYLEFEEGGNCLAAGTFGNCGFAYGAAIGAKVARPEDESVAFVGDGAWGMQSMNEVMMCVREGINVNAVVFNNMQWGAEKQNQYWFYQDRFQGTDLPENPDFAEIARDMGAHGIRVEDPDEITGAVEEMLETDKPSVLDIRTDGTELLEPFRRDALDDPERILEKYRQPGDPNYEE
ncbi:sulfoacetaldehyde acetyltransferase [Natrialbaceae archaeon AArc-T1-2]|uniref:sulfoacetaldehyde acetyltransferase n=1 Tax=Natrialbaceae archaeon AArc-T1-2 TaxID=3053904 RepID=UPI00255B3FDF|nr:sulfoacetaldehyde acetyltransferase [Natrialbaceae archaeon AArc-T1-2]WIV65922.1 sulfoacetaldehyde acetyltransferase [Natrialbaceae archaeon AArc-T1-2]